MGRKLTLVATPIDDKSSLNVETFNALLEAANSPEKNIILVEDPKPARRRWIRFGLPREAIKNFIFYNEQTCKNLVEEIVLELKSGKNAFLLSDAGLPAFCDPGRDLVERCHQEGIVVTSTPFFNSVILAIALSGFGHQRFIFHGFPDRKSGAREKFIREVISEPRTGVMMDTPYRLINLLQAVSHAEQELNITRQYFLALDLGKDTEKMLRGGIVGVLREAKKLQRVEFILVIGEFCR